MALLVVATGDGAETRIALSASINGQSAYTICLWVNFPTIDSTIDILATGGYNDADHLLLNSDGSVGLSALVGYSGTSHTTSADTIATGQWYHLAIVRSSTSLVEVYIDGVSVLSDTNDISSRPAWSAGGVESMLLSRGYSSYTSYYAAEVKVFASALSSGAISRERRISRPSKAYVGYWPLRGTTSPYGGGSGSLSVFDSSPDFGTGDHPKIIAQRRFPELLPQAAAGGGSGAISGTATVALTGSGTLKGAGALGGTSTVVLTGSGALKGAGALVGTATVVLTGSGSLKGAGALVGTATVAITGTGALKGDGALVGTATVAITGSGSLKGAGALGGTATVTFTGSASAGGESGISGTATVSITGSGDLRGSGALAGAASVALSGSGTLVDLGAGAISGTTTVTFAGSGTMTGQVLSVLTVGTFGPISIAAGSEWYITLTGPALDAPKVRITVS